MSLAETSIEIEQGFPRNPDLSIVDLRPFEHAGVDLPTLFPQISEAEVILYGDPPMPEPQMQIKLSRASYRRAGDSLLDTGGEFMTMAAHMVADIDDPEEQKAAARRLVAPLLDDLADEDAPNMALAIDQTALPVAQLGVNFKRLETLSFELVTELKSMLGDNPRNHYELLRLFDSANTYIKPTSNPYDDQRKTLLALCSIVALQNPENDLGGNLVKQLIKGEFDEFIANDLLSGQCTNSLETTQNEKRHLLRLVELMKACPGGCTEEEAVAALSKASSLAVWPLDSQKIFEAKKANLILCMNTAIAKSRHVLAVENRFSIRRGVTNEELDRVMQLHKIERNKSFVLPKQASGGHESTKSSPEPSKRKAIPRQADQAAQVAVAETVAVVPKPREIVFIDHLGSELTKDNPGFEKLIRDYTDQHLGDQHLVNDVENILEHLSRLDFSNGRIPGIKKLKDTHTRRGDRDLDVFSFKTFEAVGLPTASRNAKKTRVLFSIEDGKVLILAISDRDKVRETVRGKFKTNSGGGR